MKRVNHTSSYFILKMNLINLPDSNPRCMLVSKSKANIGTVLVQALAIVMDSGKLPA